VLKAIPGISKKILVISLAVLFLVSMVFFVSPGKIHASVINEDDWESPNLGDPNLDEWIFTPEDTSSVWTNKDVTITAGQNTVFLPEGTIITRSGGGNFDAQTLAANAVANLASLSGFGSGNDVFGALQWGIPGMGLEFSKPITITIFIGTAYAGQTIYILRSVTGTSDWTSAGIVDPAVVVSETGFITFQATKASTYAATETDTVASSSKPLTPEEQVLRDLSIGQQVDLYGKTTTGFTKMLYDNILDRVPDSNGLDYWVNALNNGMTPGQVVFNLVFSEELKSKIAAKSPTEFVTFLYEIVLNREPDSQGLANWVDKMKNGMSKEDVLLHFLDSEEFHNICMMFGFMQ